jgi:hypothetical protein
VFALTVLLSINLFLRECSENCVNQNLLNWLVYKTVFLSDEKVKNKQSVLFYGGD